MGTGELLGKPDEMLRGGGGVALDGLASHPEESSNTLRHFMRWKLG